MHLIQQSFEDRLGEIEEYLNLLDALERQVQSGPPIIGGAAITSQQQKILYSSVYLQLYNLVEATLTWCVEAVASASFHQSRWCVADLSEKILREWVRSNARTHEDLNRDNRLESAVLFCNLIIASEPLTEWQVERGGGGNWDDIEIQSICSRLGLDLKLPQHVYEAAKRVIRDDKGALKLVKSLRNKLAHGELSFSECGAGITVTELRDLKERTANYLREVVNAFTDFISHHGFIAPAKRPVGGAA